MIKNPINFPIHALPPQVYEAVIEAHELTKAPPPDRQLGARGYATTPLKA